MGEAKKLFIVPGISPLDAVSAAAKGPKGINIINGVMLPFGVEVYNSPRAHLGLLSPLDHDIYQEALVNIFLGTAGPYFKRAINAPLQGHGIIDFLEDLDREFYRTSLEKSVPRVEYLAKADADGMSYPAAKVSQAKMLKELDDPQDNMVRLFEPDQSGSFLFKSTHVYHFLDFYLTHHGIRDIITNERLIRQGGEFEEAVLNLRTSPREEFDPNFDNQKWKDFLTKISV